MIRGGCVWDGDLDDGEVALAIEVPRIWTEVPTSLGDRCPVDDDRRVAIEDGRRCQHILNCGQDGFNDQVVSTGVECELGWTPVESVSEGIECWVGGAERTTSDMVSVLVMMKGLSSR